MQHTNGISLSPMMIAKVVHCIESAVGDDIRIDIQRNNLKTRIGDSGRIWDFLNTNLINTLDTTDCTIARTRRGPSWEMLIIFEESTRCIFTFMREKRFAELRRCQQRRAKMHYLNILTKQFNHELLPDYQQLCILPHVFLDEDKLTELVQELLCDLEGSADIVRHHVLVLFDTFRYQLTSVRAVMITPDLEIAQNCEWDWSQYITTTESIVVEKVTNHQSVEICPTHSLSLKSKAIVRQKDKLKQKNELRQKKTDDGNEEQVTGN